MTTVYGVTKYGARHQILKQLKDIPEFPEKYQWSASIYLTETVFKCLEKMFTSSKQIQVCNLKSSDFMKKSSTVLPISTKQTLTSRINNWTQKRPQHNYDVDNPGSVLGQAQQCGRVKPVNGICLKYQTIDPESDHKHLSHKCPILRRRH